MKKEKQAARAKAAARTAPAPREGTKPIVLRLAINKLT